MDFKIVADSSADIKELKEVPFDMAPLSIIADNKEFVDDKKLDIKEMCDFLNTFHGKTSTSCPNTDSYLRAFGDAKYIFCITISAALSGSYSSAVTAKEIYEKRFPDRKVYVINSLSTGGEMKLIIEKLSSLILEGKDYEEIKKEIEEYRENTTLIFMLSSLKRLANNGRVSKLTAKTAGMLSIRIVGKASSEGTLDLTDKCRGEKKALLTIFENMTDLGYKGGKVRISHCFNERGAESLKNIILTAFPESDVEVYPTLGLCSYYAENGGMILGFEK